MKRLCLVLVASACLPAFAAGQVVEEIVTRVNNQIITRSEYIRSKDQLRDQVKQEDSNNADKLFADREKDVLRDLVDQALLLDKGKDLSITGDTELIKRLDQMRKDMKLASLEDLEKEATKQGISWEDFKQNMKNQIITQKVIGEEVSQHLSVTKEEEEGYYYGFANEGLWPLCHIAHTRPTFRTSDWEHYITVNEKFADALMEEMAGEAHPVVLIQDYHFALLPRMLKDRMPHARIAIFWHIPWPNSESFGICPWQRELLDGLLGADLIGFHVQAHCNNFLSSVDRVLESRIDWEHFSVKRNDHRSLVRPFPISVEFSGDGSDAPEEIEEERSLLLSELGIEATFLGVGVDRLDYTKGIIERFQAIESFLERYPRYQDKFTFVQIGAPTRSRIKRYADFQTEVEAEANRINARFKRGKWKPIILQNRQHSHHEVQRYYRAAHLCMVTSLHDGMNLVAKEYVAARHDERGVLILSQFTGAARELHDAIIVNPYDIQATAEAIAQAIEMNIGEMVDRMRRMRKFVKEHNIYWWASSLIGELCDLRLEDNQRTTATPFNKAQRKDR